MRARELGPAYAEACQEWRGDDAAEWEPAGARWPDGSQDSKAQAGKIRSVAVERVGPLLGRSGADLTARLDAAIRLHPAL